MDANPKIAIKVVATVMYSICLGVCECVCVCKTHGVFITTILLKTDFYLRSLSWTSVTIAAIRFFTLLLMTFAVIRCPMMITTTTVDAVDDCFRLQRTSFALSFSFEGCNRHQHHRHHHQSFLFSYDHILVLSPFSFFSDFLFNFDCEPSTIDQTIWFICLACLFG